MRRMLLSHITRTCKIFTIILGSDSVTTKAYSKMDYCTWKAV